jgi:Fe-Mn family superoxide dismutase
MTASRREILIAGLGALAAASVARPSVSRAAAPFAQPPLPFAENALEPVISARTVGLHYGKHHKGYFDKLNDLVKGTHYESMTLEEVVRGSARSEKDRKIFNNAAQAWNHVVYWDVLKPGGPQRPEGALAAAIEESFGGFDAFKAQILATSDGVFGTGWVWLTKDKGKLVLRGYQDADNPMASGKPAYLGIDVWEHAYYLDYENRRGQHVAALVDKAINWGVVEERLKA